MYLLYIDESGQPKGRPGVSSDYFVLAGLALHEQDCFPFATHLEDLLRQTLPREYGRLEFHATDIWAGRKDWSRYSEDLRHQLLDDAFKLIGTWATSSGRGLQLFAVAIDKKSHRGKDVVALAHEELLSRFDSFLVRLHLSGESHRALIISDESRHEKLLQSLVPVWRNSGSRIGRLRSFVEVPLFVDSRTSRIVQSADFVAWSVWQYYEHGATEFMQALHPRFDSADGIQHGVAHLIRNYRKCRCVACSSRRLHTIADVLTQPPV